MPTIKVRANASGALVWSGQQLGAVSGDTVTLTDPDLQVSVPQPQFSRKSLGTRPLSGSSGSTVTTWRQVLTGYQWYNVAATFPVDGTLTVRYRPTGDDEAESETYTVSTVEFDLPKLYGESVVPGSARFTFGGSTFVHRGGILYSAFSPSEGVGTPAGDINASTGRVRLTDWVSGGANSISLSALVTEVGAQPQDDLVFRTVAAPIKTGSLQIRWEDLQGAAYSKTPGSTGILEDNDCTIGVDYERGLVRIRFGRWRTVASLTPEELTAPWYSPESVINVGGVDSIWQSKPMMASTLVYNAVATTMLPPDSTLLGLDAARLPPSGRALIFRPGMLVLAHNTQTLNKATLVNGETIDCGRARLYRVVIEDSAGLRLPADQYVVDREAGTLLMADPIDQAGFTAPWKIKHTVADLKRVRTTDINGSITLLGQVSHAFPSLTSYLSGMLFVGTLQARVSNVFALSTFTVWSDTLTGSAPLANYADSLFPIVVTNKGAYPDRILVQFTSSTVFRVIGEQLGIIGTGDINNNCAPVNALTGEPYFTIDYRGWGIGWATGNCLRFNVHGACYPVDAVRAIQPGDPSGDSDAVELLLVGNVDA